VGIEVGPGVARRSCRGRLTSDDSLHWLFRASFCCHGARRQGIGGGHGSIVVDVVVTVGAVDGF
jgi:hypothetical protein